MVRSPTARWSRSGPINRCRSGWTCRCRRYSRPGSMSRCSCSRRLRWSDGTDLAGDGGPEPPPRHDAHWSGGTRVSLVPHRRPGRGDHILAWVGVLGADLASTVGSSRGFAWFSDRRGGCCRCGRGDLECGVTWQGARTTLARAGSVVTALALVSGVVLVCIPPDQRRTQPGRSVAVPIRFLPSSTLPARSA